MAMSNPPHPGRSIRENCLDPLGLNVTEAAKVLGVARHTLSRVLNGTRPSPRRWPFGLRRRAGPMPSSGCADRPLGISSRRARTKTGSTSSDTSRSRRCEVMQISCCNGHVSSRQKAEGTRRSGSSGNNTLWPCGGGGTCTRRQADREQVPASSTISPRTGLTPGTQVDPSRLYGCRAGPPAEVQARPARRFGSLVPLSAGHAYASLADACKAFGR